MIEKYLSLYIHIPFCVRKCDYCDFLSAPADENTKEAYIQALLLEIESYRTTGLADREIRTVFFGGGTPSVLSAGQITTVLEKAHEVFGLPEECEISIEVNPGTVTKEKCKCYFNAGINRISIGLQSPEDELLRELGRIHTYEQFLQTYEYVRNVGFQNVNVDLMSALPKQSVEQYCSGLEKVTKLSPEHISAYSLILEEGTPFFEKYNNTKNLLPDELQDRLMYERTKEILEQKGYARYEISNYARPGFECKHNIVYWERDDYLGLGLGSASLVNDTRFKNESNLIKYIRAWKENRGETVLRLEEEILSRQAQMEEFMFLGLRMMRGVSALKFYELFDVWPQQVYGRQVERLEKEGLLSVRKGILGPEKDGGGYLMLTDKGIDVSNYVFEQFLL